ncbi:MAG TPA: hypothetical protein VIU37_05340, partial [Candidatus Limnocylindrales bacterium]
MKTHVHCQTCGCAVVVDGVADPLIRRTPAGPVVDWPEGEPDVALIHRNVVEEIAEHLTVTEDTSDGFHTFRELYAVRLALTSAFFCALTEWGALDGAGPWRSKLHHDGAEPFGGGWFIVGVTLSTGQVTFHYPMSAWRDF